MVELLLAVAIALTGRPDLQLDCGPLPITGHYWGVASPEPPHIWLRKWVCEDAVKGKHLQLTAFAHEILHIRRDPWCARMRILYKVCHKWIYKWDDWYAENVVRWKMRRLTPSS